MCFGWISVSVELCVWRVLKKWTRYTMHVCVRSGRGILFSTISLTTAVPHTHCFAFTPWEWSRRKQGQVCSLCSFDFLFLLLFIGVCLIDFFLLFAFHLCVCLPHWPWHPLCTSTSLNSLAHLQTATNNIYSILAHLYFTIWVWSPKYNKMHQSASNVGSPSTQENLAYCDPYLCFLLGCDLQWQRKSGDVV